MPRDTDPTDTPPESSVEADARKARLVKAGVAVGIGSAAIVAALLYANRSKKAK